MNMLLLYMLYLGAFLAAVTSAHRDPPGRSPWGYIAILKGKMNTLCGKVDTLEKEVETLEKEVDTLVKEVDTLEKEVDTLVKEVDTVVKEVVTLDKKVETCCDLSSSQPETVYAQMELVELQSFSSPHTVKFDTTIANVGDAYDPISGQFEAPVNGTYLFSASMCSFTNDKWFHFDIIQDGSRLTTGTVGDKNWGECGSATAVTYMMKGSVVWVEIINAIEEPLMIDARHAFTASLLNTYSNP